MSVRFYEITPSDLVRYAQIPIAFPVTSIFHVEILDGGLGGFRLVEEPVTPSISILSRKSRLTSFTPK